MQIKEDELFDFLKSGINENFTLILEGRNDISLKTLKPGDLILRNMNAKLSPYYHVGTYCGNHEVIEFTANVNGWLNWIVWAIGSSLSDVVSSVVKVSVKNFVRGKQYRVLRLKNAIPEDFSHRVPTAMDSTEEYNSTQNNCMHFALRLLG